MNLKLERIWCGPEATVGTLYIDGVQFCYTLEDCVRENGKSVNSWKIAGKTAIPTGAYNVIVTPSQRFKRDLPLLENVPGFSGIRIHPGNTAADTEGCILVGKGHSTRTVTDSRAAFNDLFDKIKAALTKKDVVTMEVS